MMNLIKTIKKNSMIFLFFMIYNIYSVSLKEIINPLLEITFNKKNAILLSAGLGLNLLDKCFVNNQEHKKKFVEAYNIYIVKVNGAINIQKYTCINNFGNIFVSFIKKCKKAEKGQVEEGFLYDAYVKRLFKRCDMSFWQHHDSGRLEDFFNSQLKDKSQKISSLYLNILCSSIIQYILFAPVIYVFIEYILKYKNNEKLNALSLLGASSV